MTLQNKVTHAANVAKWEIDQTGRILNMQSEINDLSSQIDYKKELLADKVYRLYLDSKIDHEDLNPLLSEIKELFVSLQEKESQLESVKAEESPSLESPHPFPVEGKGSPAVAEEAEPPLELSGLVCPVCGLGLVGKFCPKHGDEGIFTEVPEDLELPEKPEAPEVSESVVSSVLPEGKLVCPTCKLPLVGKFCPEHGVSGVPVVSPKNAEQQSEKKDASQGPPIEVLVCPECGQKLVGKFCPEHGVEGIIKTN